jgi:aspartyl-tRNA(Asn)/glutamyl-tRNA(Gln) amidotransferase subunit C
MKIDPSTIDKMAHLARLNVHESEKAGIAESLEQILSWMEKLNELNTDGVEPLVHMSAEINSMRQDVASQPMNPATALSNAPSSRDSFFVVPKVLDV